jgi:hypothetical protein
VVLAGVAPDQLSPYSPHLAQQLLQEGAEGRLWEGKEGLLTALGALSAACTATLCVVPGEGWGHACWGSGDWCNIQGLSSMPSWHGLLWVQAVYTCRAWQRHTVNTAALAVRMLRQQAAGVV